MREKTKAMHDEATAVIDAPVKEKLLRKKEHSSTKPKRQPRYHVILWDDNDHTYEYVSRMMKQLFGHDSTQGQQIAKKVDNEGRAVCLTTTLEHAELKRDQIHAFGRDQLIPRCSGSMSCTLEPDSNE